MIRKRQRAAAIILIMIMVLSLSSVDAAAESKYKYKVRQTLRMNKWTTVKENYVKSDTWIINLYKIKVPSDGYITIKNKPGKKYSATVYFNKYRNDENSEGWIDPGQTAKFAVDKGTYYLSTNVASTDPSTAAKVKYSFRTVKPKANYSPGTAAALKPGKKQTICFTPKNSHDRWYKIQLKSQKKITVWSSYGESIHIYDSRFKRIDLEQAGTKSTKYTTRKQKKGTYYICIDAFDYDSYQDKRPVITLKWK